MEHQTSSPTSFPSAKELFRAVEAGDVARVRQFVLRDRTLANARTEQGCSAVLHAMNQRQAEVAADLVLCGASLDIHEAAATGHIERLEELVTLDASCLWSCSAEGWTPLHLAAFFGQKRAVAFLLERGTPVAAWSKNSLPSQPLHAAVAGNDAEVCRLLLERGAPADEKQHGGFRPLHGAAEPLLGVLDAVARCASDSPLWLESRTLAGTPHLGCRPEGP